ncbi:hypothetical protein SAMN05421811_12741 [Nonomuraea wenchangensis]|uniref:Uncharacterized protein n=1 Tax=Nonomuraea wenchangensis TaxID=568860 RepID=A0A1I0LTS1_9ACTN|nr:hypothetical protein SAMN05421811_12741 [Nonomuraea wenchangensis]
MQHDPCHWYENPDRPGERFLIPCCYERLEDPDTCTCELPIEELRRLRAENRELRARLDQRDRDFLDLAAAISGRPDARAIWDQMDAYRQRRAQVAAEDAQRAPHHTVRATPTLQDPLPP